MLFLPHESTIRRSLIDGDRMKKSKMDTTPQLQIEFRILLYHYFERIVSSQNSVNTWEQDIGDIKLLIHWQCHRCCVRATILKLPLSPVGKGATVYGRLKNKLPSLPEQRASLSATSSLIFRHSLRHDSIWHVRLQTASLSFGDHGMITPRSHFKQPSA